MPGIDNLTVKSRSIEGPLPWLCHYTSVHGVEGILTSRSIRASLLHFMNDSKEWLYALDLVREYLARKVQVRGDRNWLAFIAELSGSLERIRGLNVFVFSLSAASNQLSQWRAYCPIEGGYQIDFDRKGFERHLSRHGFRLEPCVYDRDAQLNIVATVVDPIIAGIGELKDDQAIDNEVERALNDLVEQLSLVAPVLKHPDFAEENEWRAFALVPSNDPRMGYHIKGSIIVPHCLLNLETDSHPFPVAQVTVGPNANQLLAVRGLQEIKPRVPSIGISSTPLRNL